VEFTALESRGVPHAMGFGALFLLAIAGGVAGRSWSGDSSKRVPVGGAGASLDALATPLPRCILGSFGLRRMARHGVAL
jgi:hypothetical protein